MIVPTTVLEFKRAKGKGFMRLTETARLQEDLLKEQWLWNYSWRGVRLDALQKAYGVSPSDILSTMRGIAEKHDPPDVKKLPNSRCRSCSMRIFWGKLNEEPHPFDPKILVIVTDTGTIARGRESHFVSCPNASEHRRKGVT